jgi:hypothetical protein
MEVRSLEYRKPQAPAHSAGKAAKTRRGGRSYAAPRILGLAGRIEPGAPEYQVLPSRKVPVGSISTSSAAWESPPAEAWSV